MRRIVVTTMCIAAVTGANAHDWYQNKVDPVTNFKCCGGTDCRPIPQSSVQPRGDGGYVYLPDGFNIPPERVQESPDGRYHICESTYVITNQPYLRCFFAPRLKVSRLLPTNSGSFLRSVPLANLRFTTTPGLQAIALPLGPFQTSVDVLDFLPR